MDVAFLETSKHKEGVQQVKNPSVIDPKIFMMFSVLFNSLRMYVASVTVIELGSSF